RDLPFLLENDRERQPQFARFGTVLLDVVPADDEHIQLPPLEMNLLQARRQLRAWTTMRVGEDQQQTPSTEIRQRQFPPVDPRQPEIGRCFARPESLPVQPAGSQRPVVLVSVL